MPKLQVIIPKPTPKQLEFIDHPAKRKIIRAGRRGGKTVGVGIMAVEDFMRGRRVLYAAPTQEQIGRFWSTVTQALAEPINKGKLYKNESEHIVEVKGTENRIRAKTAWNADTLRGDYADKLILDEWQLMNEDAWGLVGAPMLLDTNGDAVFVYTPPSLRSRSVSKAKDPQHAAKMFKRFAELEKIKPNRYGTFHFTSHENPYISAEALEEIMEDMTSLAHRMEILAEDIDESPGALWKRDIIEKNRVHTLEREYDMIVVGVDPSATSLGDEAGIVTVGKKGDHGYVLSDDSVQGSPLLWAKTAVEAFHRYKANKIIAESNNGGEMVSTTIAQIDRYVPVELVHASRGKSTRAEPVSALYEHNRGHHCGSFPYLEDEMCLWVPGSPSPNRMDALVWAYVGLGLVGTSKIDWEKVVGGRR